MLIFKKEYREIYLKDDYSIRKLSNQINKIYSSNLYSRISNERIIVKKKYFSDFFLFNLGHLGSMTIHAKSVGTRSQAGRLKFIVEMNDSTKFLTKASVLILGGLVLFFLVNFHFVIVLTIVLFMILGILWSRVVHNYGITNFIKNWDKYIVESM